MLDFVLGKMLSNRRNRRPEDISPSSDGIKVIWLDEHIHDSEASRRTQELLCELNESALFYTEPSLLFDYVKSITNEKILLIISRQLYTDFSCKIHSLDVIHSTMLYCNEHSDSLPVHEEYPDLNEIHTDEGSLIRSISNNINLMLKGLLVFTLNDSNTQKSTRDAASAVWFQLSIHMLKKLPHTDQAKEEMLSKCSDSYQSNQQELKKN